MERKVTFRDRQEQQAADHNNLQAFVAETFDDLVFDAIHNGKAFAGFETTATGTTEVTIQPGQLYAAGAMHVARDVTVKSLFEYLPVATRRKVALVTWATEGDVDVQPRDFLINVDTGETEPQAVSMEHRRVANVGTQPGIESPDPSPPVLSEVLLPFAIVTLTTTGIESIEMVVSNRLPRLRDMHASVKTLISWKDATEPRITTIASDITALASRIGGTTTQRDLFRVYADVARLKELADLPDDYADYAADRFLTKDETDVANVNLLAKVEEGVRFADANAGLSELNVFSTLDPNQVISGGVLLPKHGHVTRLNIDGYVGEVSVSQYGYQTFDVVERMMSRRRIRYGTTYTVCTNNAWWRSGTYDPASHIFRHINGETFEILDNPDTHGGNVHYIRFRQFWYDVYEEPYWDYVVNDHTITGAQVAQSVLNSQDGWLTKVGFYLTRRAGSGNLNLTICETVAGAPDLSKAVMHMTVPYEQLKLFPQQTLVSIPPTFLKAGSRYAVVITTNADHWLAMASGNSYAQGTFFYSTDGAFYQGDLTRDLMLELQFARFNAPRVEIALQPLQLDGGIAAIDILADTIVPGATELRYEVQVGGAWVPLSEVDTRALITLPPLLPLRAIFLGTSDIMPGLKLVGSQVLVSRPRTTFKHISTARILPAPTSTVRLQLRLESWSQANHACTANLKVGVGFATTEAPDVTETVIVDDYAIIKTFTFNLAAPVSTFKIEIDGSTTSALDVFHVGERVDVEI